MTQHRMVPSTLGHGSAMCAWCYSTDRELHALGLTFEACPSAPLSEEADAPTPSAFANPFNTLGAPGVVLRAVAEANRLRDLIRPLNERREQVEALALELDRALEQYAQRLAFCIPPTKATAICRELAGKLKVLLEQPIDLPNPTQEPALVELLAAAKDVMTVVELRLDPRFPTLRAWVDNTVRAGTGKALTEANATQRLLNAIANAEPYLTQKED